MSRFERESKRVVTGRGPSAAPYDPLLGDITVQWLGSELRRGVWTSLDAVLDGRNDEWLITGLLASDEAMIPKQVVREWALAAPSARSVSMLGAMMIRDAWRARGNQRASLVPEDAWPVFRRRLERAETVLEAAAERWPGSADPWAQLVTTGRGLDRPTDEIAWRFNQVQGRDPFRPDACRSMLQSECAKWGGSDGAMFHFARWVEDEAPADSPARSVLPMAHFEHAIRMSQNGVPVSHTLGDRATKAELIAAATRFVDAIPDTAPTAALGPLNAYLLTISPIDGRSARLIEKIDQLIAGRPTGAPWRYWGDDPAQRFRAVRAERLRDAHAF